MQTRAWTKRFEPDQIKIFLVATLVSVVLILGAVLAEGLASSDQASSISRAGASGVRPTPNTRFLERNILPGDDTLIVPPDGERGTRY